MDDLNKVLEAILGQIEETRASLGEIQKASLDLADAVPPEMSENIQQAISRIWEASRNLGRSVEYFQKQPSKKKNEENIDVDLAELGFARILGEDGWYRNPEGDQLHLPESKIFVWEHYPPRMRGDRTKGQGWDSLKDHLAEKSGPRYSITQNDRGNYQVHGPDEKYPSLVGENNGEWKCYTCEQGDGDHHVEAVKRWVSGGRKAVDTQYSGYERPQFHMQKQPVGMPDKHRSFEPGSD